MHIIEQPPAPLSLDGIFKSVSLTTDEKKAVGKAQAKISEIFLVIERTMPDSKIRDGGKFSWLHYEADSAAAKFAESLTLDAAEAYHDALVRVRDAEVSFGQIDQHCHIGLAAASQSIRSVCEAVIGRACEILDSEAASHRAAMAKSAAVFGEDHELSVFDQRLGATRDALNGELAEARRDPLAWLSRYGFAE